MIDRIIQENRANGVESLMGINNYLRYAFRHMLRGDKVDYIIGVQGNVIGLKINGVDTYHVVAAKQYKVRKDG